MHFHLGWLGPSKGFGQGGYYARDDRYGSVGHQQDERTLRQENWMVQNPKLVGSVSPKDIYNS
jgi:hypothetical protein